MQIAAVILTGGHSTRMGRDKGGLRLGGETLLNRLCRRYEEAFGAVYLSVDRPGRYPGYQEIPDLRPEGQGPLAGLEAAFLSTGAQLLFLSAVDLPFGETALAQRLMALRGDCAACYIRRSDGRPEPLFAIYSRAVLPCVTACLDEGRRSFRAMIERVDARAVREEELPEFDLERVLLNVNRPEDYQRAREIFS